MGAPDSQGTLASGPRAAQTASGGATEVSEGFQMCRGASRQPQIASRRPKRTRRALHRGPQAAKTMYFL
eukprot:6995762-Pyramimonas_sp.AAC.1